MFSLPSIGWASIRKNKNRKEVISSAKNPPTGRSITDDNNAVKNNTTQGNTSSVSRDILLPSINSKDTTQSSIHPVLKSSSIKVLDKDKPITKDKVVTKKKKMSEAKQAKLERKMIKAERKKAKGERQKAKDEKKSIKAAQKNAKKQTAQDKITKKNAKSEARLARQADKYAAWADKMLKSTEKKMKRLQESGVDCSTVFNPTKVTSIDTSTITDVPIPTIESTQSTDSEQKSQNSRDEDDMNHDFCLMLKKLIQKAELSGNSARKARLESLLRDFDMSSVDDPSEMVNYHEITSNENIDSTPDQRDNDCQRCPHYHHHNYMNGRSFNRSSNRSNLPQQQRGEDASHDDLDQTISQIPPTQQQVIDAIVGVYNTISEQLGILKNDVGTMNDSACQFLSCFLHKLAQTFQHTTLPSVDETNSLSNNTDPQTQESIIDTVPVEDLTLVVNTGSTPTTTTTTTTIIEPNPLEVTQSNKISPILQQCNELNIPSPPVSLDNESTFADYMLKQIQTQLLQSPEITEISPQAPLPPELSQTSLHMPLEVPDMDQYDDVWDTAPVFSCESTEDEPIIDNTFPYIFDSVNAFQALDNKLGEQEDLSSTSDTENFFCEPISSINSPSKFNEAELLPATAQSAPPKQNSLPLTVPIILPTPTPIVEESKSPNVIIQQSLNSAPSHFSTLSAHLDELINKRVYVFEAYNRIHNGGDNIPRPSSSTVTSVTSSITTPATQQQIATSASSTSLHNPQNAKLRLLEQHLKRIDSMISETRDQIHLLSESNYFDEDDLV